MSLTNVSFNAQTANSTTQQFNVLVPSENVFIDRAVDWVSSGVVQLTVTLAGTVAANYPLLVPSQDVSLAAFPSHQCVAQMTATINDATVTVNTQDVMNYVLRLQDLAKNRKQRTCPTKLDIYAYNPDTTKFPNSPLNGYSDRYAADEAPNGSFAQWWFADSTGSALYGSGTYTGGTYINGVPVTAAATTSYPIYIRWQSAEKLLLPPFIFGDDYELSTGFFGVQNFQVQMNMSASPSRAIRLASSVYSKTIGPAGTTTTIQSISSPTWATGISGAYAPYPFQPALSVQFLTPAIDVPLPPKSIVPYMEFPRYITTGLPSIGSTLGTTASSAKSTATGTVVSSNTITLPNIPDLLLLYLKPSTPGATLFSTAAPYPGGGTTWDSTIGDFSLPIQGVSINFDNFSGLLANHTQYELYKMSVANGLEMDWSEWSGEGRCASALSSSAAVVGTAAGNSPFASLVGGPLVLRPGRDFALQAGQAPGLVGNFTLQVQLTVGNQFSAAIATGAVNLYIVPVSSGFFETIKGSSRIIKGVLTEQDILAAPPRAPEPALERLVGEGKHHSGAKHKGKSVMSQYM